MIKIKFKFLDIGGWTMPKKYLFINFVIHVGGVNLKNVRRFNYTYIYIK